ncbi:hypothetical protein OJAV_G00092200 [Oryzias javanicus]|uniref:Cationic amino acid transporter C-terminal domain-containing protein n=1 Tax=Oryzias javanicus TaxID=123683 RepID=A0A3S2MJT6_ORYJA|nr:hypothetical protein OJAV_G00092200 [Oryzias javanicus]
MGVIVFILVFGFVLAEPANWSQEQGGFAPFGLSGILAGSATCFYAFVGFDVIASSSEEAKNPQKAVPVATAISLGLAATAYILVSTVLTLMVPWRTLDPNSALADAFFRRGYSWAGIVVAVGSICAMNTVLLCNLFSLPRIVYAMAEDGLFFSIFARVNPLTKVPVNAILVFGILMATMALIFDLEALVQFLSIGTLLAYTFVAAKSQAISEDSDEPKQYESLSDKIQLVERQVTREQRGVGQLRASWEPYLDRLVGDSLHSFGFTNHVKNTTTFQVPLVPLTPGASILINIFLMMKLSLLTWIRFTVWIAIGLIVYFGYGIWHSKEGKRELQPKDMAARYVVLPSGSLVETVQSVQPDGQVDTSGHLVSSAPAAEECAEKR